MIHLYRLATCQLSLISYKLITHHSQEAVYRFFFLCVTFFPKLSDMDILKSALSIITSPNNHHFSYLKTSQPVLVNIYRLLRSWHRWLTKSTLFLGVRDKKKIFVGVFFICLGHHEQPDNGLKKIVASQEQCSLEEDTLLSSSYLKRSSKCWYWGQKMWFENWISVGCHILL